MTGVQTCALPIFNASGNLGYIGWGSSVTNHLNIYNEKNADVIIGSNNIERLRILSGGNIGIGTGTSSSAFSGSAKVLSIVDNTTLNVSSFRAYGGGTTTSIELFGGTSYVGLYGSTNHPMTFWTNATEQMRIFTTGNVGINTTTDAGYKLDVNGSTRIKGTGTTSATTSFIVQNSSGNNSFYVRDDGVIGNDGLYISGQSISGPSNSNFINMSNSDGSTKIINTYGVQLGG